MENALAPIVSQDVQLKTDEESTEPWTVEGPFRFFDLPSELRIRIYELALVVPRTVDYDPSNHSRIKPRFNLFLACRRLYEEAYPIFYGRNTIRLFPTHFQFLNAKKALLTRLPRKYRQTITSLELRLGPGWGKPPKIQALRPRLGLADCTSVRHLRVFVECDPSHDVFKGFRVDSDFYTVFCGGMLEGILHNVPSIQEIEFDAYSFVKKEDELMKELIKRANGAKKRITWGPLRRWDLEDRDLACDVEGLEHSIAILSL